MKATDVMEGFFFCKLPNFLVLMVYNYEIDTQTRINDHTYTSSMENDNVNGINGILTLMRSILIINNRGDIDYAWR